MRTKLTPEERKQRIKDSRNRRKLKFQRTHSCCEKTIRNRKSKEKATMDGERWTDVEDSLLFEPGSDDDLAALLGRTIQAIDSRRWWLKKQKV
jgi:hypothetical protein